jgi:hypothetical protein
MLGSCTFCSTEPYTTACTSAGVDVGAGEQLGDAAAPDLGGGQAARAPFARANGRAEAGDDGDAPAGLAVGRALVEVRVGHAAR